MSASRAVVVGGGLIGLSIARALTERGLTDVLVLERGLLASGGTGKSSGIVRAHYGVPSIAAMAWRSLPVFEALGAEVGFRQVGYTVVVGEENAGPLKDNTAMHQGLGIEVDLVDPDQVAALWPMMKRRVRGRHPAGAALRPAGPCPRCAGAPERAGRAGRHVGQPGDGGRAG